MFLRLNVQATINVKISVAMTEDDVKFLGNVENTIREMVEEAFGSDFNDERGYQKIDVKILQNELTNL